MGGEGGASEAHHAAQAYLLDYLLGIGRDIGHKRVGSVYSFHPFVAFDCNLYAHLGKAGEVGTGSDGLDRAGDGRMDICRDETARFSYRLSHLDLVSHCHEGLGGSADMLGHGNIYCRRQGQRLYGALTRNLAVVGMDSAY